MNQIKLPIGEAVPEWTTKQLPQKTKMQGRYCCLYPLDLKKHSIPLYEAFCKDKDNLNWTYLPYGPFENYEDFKKWLVDFCLTKDPFFFVVVKKDTVVGLASYLRIKPEVGVIEIGHIHFSPLLQKTRASESLFMTENQAVSLFAPFVNG